ncbi:GNAT family N-acetyltransferase [Kribbella sp. NPDC056861]|uniref:GNAT family N-acetyltransferase n=1 Tax=Kribbella sp. NPDC056861 TaxID=3154857 RepID=UPI00343D404C
MTEANNTDRAAVLLAAYDDQLRGNAEAADVPTSTDGPLIRVEYPNRGFVSYRSLEGLDGAELDALIARQREYFAAKGDPVEWKTRGHDLPADLPERLVAAGFVPEERETVVIGESADIVERLAGRETVDGVTIRRTEDKADFERIAAMESTVWGQDWSWLTDDLVSRHATGLTDIFVAEVDGEVVSAAWAVYKKNTDFTGLWGGSTLAEWRGKGIYKALVAVRAARAVELGYRYLQVDASDDSSPILQRLGFLPVTTTTPYVYTPSN